MSFLDEVTQQLGEFQVQVASAEPAAHAAAVVVPPAKLRPVYLKLVGWLPDGMQLFLIDESVPHLLMTGHVFPMPLNLSQADNAAMQQAADKLVKEDEVTERTLGILKPLLPQGTALRLAAVSAPGMGRVRCAILAARDKALRDAAHTILAQTLPTAKVTARIAPHQVPNRGESAPWVANMLFSAETLTAWLLEQT